MSEPASVACFSTTNKCYYCGRLVRHYSSKTKPMPPNQKTYDHLTPKSRGGLNVPENRAVACIVCNAEKGMLTEFEYRAVLAYRRGPLPLIRLAIAPAIKHARVRLVLASVAVFALAYRIRNMF